LLNAGETAKPGQKLQRKVECGAPRLSHLDDYGKELCVGQRRCAVLKKPLARLLIFGPVFHTRYPIAGHRSLSRAGEF
jgi:hypothetical protein